VRVGVDLQTISPLTSILSLRGERRYFAVKRGEEPEKLGASALGLFNSSEDHPLLLKDVTP